MKICKLANQEPVKEFSSCCYAEDGFLENTTPFKGLYSDLGICPLCKKECTFISKATDEDISRDIGEL